MKIKNFDVKTDVVSIECNVHNASVEIIQSQNDKLSVLFPHANHLRIAHSEGELIIKQGRRLFEKLRSPDRLIISVPSHLLPSLSVTGKWVEAKIAGGIYDNVVYAAERGSLEISSAALSELDACGNEISVSVSDVTVKGNLTVKTELGDAVLEHDFASRTECRLTNGNVGAVNLNCRETYLESLCGNITVSLQGKSEQYSLSLLAKEGVCNRESAAAEGASNNFKAYAAKGNIYIDFLGEEKEN